MSTLATVITIWLLIGLFTAIVFLFNLFIRLKYHCNPVWDWAVTNAVIFNILVWPVTWWFAFADYIDEIEAKDSIESWRDR